MMTVGAGMFADGVARCAERPRIVEWTQRTTTKVSFPLRSPKATRRSEAQCKLGDKVRYREELEALMEVGVILH